jgi:hypothetical protein
MAFCNFCGSKRQSNSCGAPYFFRTLFPCSYFAKYIPIMTRIFTLLFFVFTLTSAQAQQLISTEYKGSFTLQEMIDQFGFFMQNGVDMYKITYTTPDIEGVLDTASGLVVIPVRDEQFAYPLLCYQHGTVDGPVDVPSNLQGGYQLAAIFAGLGYVVSAADFLGLGEARGFHPYVHADTEASAAIDMLFAVREMAPQMGFYLNDQLFISGYSQGGHAAMAAHRNIQLDYPDDFTVTASAPMSGPYSVSTVFEPFVQNEIEYFFPAYIAYTVLSYDLAYDLFDNVEQYFKQPYATTIQQFRDGNFGVSTTNNLLISQLESLEGASIPKFMFQDSVINAINDDPQHPANLALADNDVFDWAPDAPTRLYYCMADDQVPFMNSVVADSVMNANGAPDVDALDVNPAADHGQCVEPATTSAILFFGNYQLLDVVNVNTIGDFEQPQVFPNPAATHFWVENMPPNARLELMDVNGKVLHQQIAQSDREEVSIQGLNAGLYLLRITAIDGGYRTVKIVVR